MITFNPLKNRKKNISLKMDALLKEMKALPKAGDLVEGTVLSVSKNEIHLDIAGLTSGVIRGKEVYDESGIYSNIKIGDKVQATVLDMENENGELELSFRFAGHQKAWEELGDVMKAQSLTLARVIDANKGGLMIKVGNVVGFLPVSQLTTEHYPRVDGGDKAKILVHLKKFIGQDLQVKIIDVNENDEKLIVSEKAAWEEEQQKALSGFKVGDAITGKVTGVVDFGAFVEFGDNLEGLVHISELAWQRIDDPKEIVKVGDTIQAQIIGIDRSKVSLSMKRLLEDPWKIVAAKYQIGDKVNGKVLKVNPFGAFVELDSEIHGLAHISELTDKKTTDVNEVIKVGSNYDFYIISLEPDDHRLGLSFKKPGEKSEKKDKEESKETTEEIAPETAE
jgi:small subunit ribosomal protein S1